MTLRAKSILSRSICDFKSQDTSQQEKSLAHVRQQLQAHENGIENIGMGLDPDTVAAAKVFLRIFGHPRPV